jgi:hypothetical protein
MDLKPEVVRHASVTIALNTRSHTSFGEDRGRDGPS